MTTAENKPSSSYIELFIICLGLIFPFAWLYTIKGSKRWQENWEAHIDMLEDYISGPLYKFVFVKGKFYSVSRINQIICNAVIFIWLAILYYYLDTNNFLQFSCDSTTVANWNVLLPLIITYIFIFQLGNAFGTTGLENKKVVFHKRTNDLLDSYINQRNANTA